MKILMACTPAIGHLDPLLAIARMALSRGDDVVLTTATWLRQKVVDAGVRFSPLDPEADIDIRNVDDFAPERLKLPPGPTREEYVFKRFFLDPMPAQARTLRSLIAKEAPDVVLVDMIFCGSTPLFLDKAQGRPSLVTVGISFLPLDRPDGAPLFVGLPPARDEATRQSYAQLALQVDAVFGSPVRAYTDDLLASLGLPKLQGSLMNERVMHCDAYVMPSVPAFEYDFHPLPDHVRFVGALPAPPSSSPDPEWWEELDDGRRVVLVTQGTVANKDFGELIEPTMVALADREDLLVVVTTGGRAFGDIRGTIPRNVRLAAYLPFATLLPKVDLLVTNGGYGTVSMALSAGVPIVVSGTSEDKAEVAARIAWSGTGLNLMTHSPTPEALRKGVSEVLDDPKYLNRARAMAGDFAKLDPKRELFALLDALTGAR
ncbi:MAG: glycosyltransferase [Janthinobacterium lividum]